MASRILTGLTGGVLLACLCLPASQLFPQEKEGEKSAQRAGAEKKKGAGRKGRRGGKRPELDPRLEAYLASTRPGKEHEVLEAIVGNWNAESKFWAAPDVPPTESTGTCRRKWILGGRFVYEEYRGKYMEVPFQGLGTTGYDKIKKAYVSVWMDSMGTGIMTQTGELDASGKVLKFTGEAEDPMSGELKRYYSLLTIKNPDRHVIQMFEERPGGNEVKLLETAFTRTPGKAERRGQAKAGLSRETPRRRDTRMKWWRDARFGMFIHWGLYAIPAGTWKERQIPGIGEWIMDRANIPVAEYEQLARRFNPVKFDAAEWVRIARGAGMKYMVITSKHHDGFCLFDSKATDYDVVDATPYGKDLLRPLAEECRKQGLQFCVYYSIMDWHHPAQYRGSEKRYNPTKIHSERKAEYMAYMKTQLRELLASCDPAVLWFDGEWPAWYTEEDGRELYRYLRELKPSIIINNRVGKGRKGMEGLNKGDREYVGDFGTPEQQIPATGLPGVDWESCMTMNNTWGYKSYDDGWKSVETLVRNVIDTASKGGNYLLNVGPTAEGLIPGPSVERLRGIGKWMAANAEAIRGTGASPFAKTPWGRCTQKRLEGGLTRLYLHVFDWPADQRLVIPGLANRPVKALLLASGKELEVGAGDAGVAIDLPEAMPDPIATVVALDVRGKPRLRD
jgi:alpha-L-fucosidase